MRSAATKAPALVIGYGNTLRGDDGAGPAAAEALRDRLPESIAEVMVVHQLLPELTEPLSRCSLAIFIDADCNIPAGQVRQESVIAHRKDGNPLGHHESPENLLEMARELYGQAPPGILFRIGAMDLGFGEGLSNPVRQAIPHLVEDVIDLVQKGLELSTSQT